MFNCALDLIKQLIEFMPIIVVLYFIFDILGYWFLGKR